LFTLNTKRLKLRIGLGVVHTEHKEIRTKDRRKVVVHTEHQEIRTKDRRIEVVHTEHKGIRTKNKIRSCSH